MSQSEKSFTVSDRRHFTAEGRPREGGPEQETAGAPTAEPGAATAEPGAATVEPGAADVESEGRREASEAPADFSHFLMGLAAECGRLLAGEGLPEGTPRSEALAGARSIVSILEMLKDKTEGRRTREEDALLAELLFQLRMAYVERTRMRQA